MSNKPIRLFYSYSHEDEELRGQLENHLSPLKRDGTIEDWSFRRITAGDEWRNKIHAKLENANIILLLISADFMASDYCYDVEMKRALQLNETGKTKVIPVILRAVDWINAPFAKLQALPSNAKSVTSWENTDEAFMDISKGIRAACKSIRSTNQKITINIPREHLEEHIYCSRCGQEAGIIKNACTNIWDSSHDFRKHQGFVFCSTCGAKPGTKSECIGLGGGHNFQEYSSILYCRICGIEVGEKTNCVNILSPTHDFTLHTNNAYCSRCGVRPGKRTECTALNASHDFIIRGRV